VHLVAELLLHDGEGRFAGAEALEPRRAGDLLEPLLDFRRDFRGGNGYFETPLEPAGSGDRYLHCLKSFN
jgi:hypothetical protein